MTSCGDSGRIGRRAVVVGAAVAPALALARAGAARAQEATPGTAGRLLEPAVGLAEAQEAALEGRTGAAVRAVELEREDGRLVWEVELDTGEEVEVDAATGEVLGTDRGDDDDDDDEVDEAGTPAAAAGGTPVAGGAAETVTVETHNFYFAPDRFSVPAGTDVTVVVTNPSDVEHSWTVPELGVNVEVHAGETKRVTLNAPAGEHPFHCEYHPDRMRGTVVAQ